MEIRFDTFDGKAKIHRQDGKIRLSIENEGKMHKRINEELEKGFLDLKDFKNSGVPGRLKLIENISLQKI